MEAKAPASNQNPFMSLDDPLRGAGSSEIAFVPQHDFDKSMADIEDAFKGAKEALQQRGGGASVPSGLSTKVDKALKRLGEIEGRVTGESFSMSNQTFCSKNEVIEWLAAEKVPSCGFFWDLSA